MDRTGDRGARGARVASLLIAGVAALVIALSPIHGKAQTQPPSPSPPTPKAKTFGKWSLYCRQKNCAIAHRTKAAIMIFGFNKSDGALVMQVRVPNDVPENRPMALRLHKSGALLHLVVSNCNIKFCVASAKPSKTDQAIKYFAKEKSGTLAYQMAQTMMIEDFSLTGFNKAIAALRKGRTAKK